MHIINTVNMCKTQYYLCLITIIIWVTVILYVFTSDVKNYLHYFQLHYNLTQRIYYIGTRAHTGTVSHDGRPIIQFAGARKPEIKSHTARIVCNLNRFQSRCHTVYIYNIGIYTIIIHI